jgi:hypothetical protein
VEEYLLTNPRARAEVEEHRDVASLLAWSGASAPEGLWDRIASSLDEPAPAPTGELASVLALDSARSQPLARAVTTGRRSAGRGWVPAVAWSALGAAAALLAVLVVSNTGEDSSEVAAPLELALAEAREDDDATVVTLVSADGQEGGEVVIDGDGHGFLVADRLPALPDDRTWQLWGVVEGEAISLGIMGAEPEIEPFTVSGTVTQVIITNEVAGGVISDGNPEGAYAGAVVG